MRGQLFQCDPACRAQVLAVLKETLEKKSEIVFAYVFGSFLEERPFHDIDVGVYVTEEAAPWMGLKVLDWAMALEQKLAQSGRRRFPVDVRLLNDAPVTFCYHVLRGRLLFCRDEERWADWAVRVVTRYLDSKPLRDRALREAMQSWN
ncbi:nucleotidyltransferase domain-containing protein [Rhodothermus marinus]|uniref:nucleotidyltransferase domain-containing protein n=1 Tax=Rhodothermus marinus TaxID=29549 RepID=UPI0006D126FC|nr:nucleotidyltransferase domain-containing protein [Rhodothermus marinus]